MFATLLKVEGLESIEQREVVRGALPGGYLIGKLVDDDHYIIAKDEQGSENPEVGYCQFASDGFLRVCVYMNGQPSLKFVEDLVQKHEPLTFYSPM